jgi:hypothetical protein
MPFCQNRANKLKIPPANKKKKPEKKEAVRVRDTGFRVREE